MGIGCRRRIKYVSEADIQVDVFDIIIRAGQEAERPGIRRMLIGRIEQEKVDHIVRVIFLPQGIGVNVLPHIIGLHLIHAPILADEKLRKRGIIAQVRISGPVIEERSVRAICSRLLREPLRGRVHAVERQEHLLAVGLVVPCGLRIIRKDGDEQGRAAQAPGRAERAVILRHPFRLRRCLRGLLCRLRDRRFRRCHRRSHHISAAGRQRHEQKQRRQSAKQVLFTHSSFRRTARRSSQIPRGSSWTAGGWCRPLHNRGSGRSPQPIP